MAINLNTAELDTLAAKYTQAKAGQIGYWEIYKWLADRAAFTTNFYVQQQRGGGIVPGGRNLRYYDAATNTQVLVGAGDAQRVQYLFGGDSADTLTGQGYEDHLYGNVGNDTLDGKGGNDWLEGGTGFDT